MIHYIQYRRYGMKHNIETLVFWEGGSAFSAQWVPQSKLKLNGVKELTEYLNRQFFFSPVWRYILNVAEVRVASSFHSRNNSTTSVSPPFSSQSTRSLAHLIVMIFAVIATTPFQRR